MIRIVVSTMVENTIHISCIQLISSQMLVVVNNADVT